MYIDKRTTSSNQTIHEYYFDNLVELIDYISTASVNTRVFRGRLSSENKDYDWYKTHSLEEAKELCLGGDEELSTIFNEKSMDFSKAFPYLSQKRTVVNSYYGHRPNINRYLTSNPKCMYRLERNETYNVVNVYYNVSASWGCSADSIFNRGIITINMIKFMESMGYRIRFNFFELCREYDEYFYTSINLKRPEERLSSSICYFPMCNPSFLRRILFRVKETTNFDYSYWNSSYGKVLDLEDLHKAYEEILGINMDNSILIGEPRSMNVSGRDLFEDAQSFFDVIDINKFLGNNQMEFDSGTKSFTLRRKR